MYHILMSCSHRWITTQVFICDLLCKKAVFQALFIKFLIMASSQIKEYQKEMKMSVSYLGRLSLSACLVFNQILDFPVSIVSTYFCEYLRNNNCSARASIHTLEDLNTIREKQDRCQRIKVGHVLAQLFLVV